MGREQDGKVPRGHVHGPQRCADRLTGFGVSRQVLHPGGAADGQRLLRRGLHVRYLLRYLLRWLLCWPLRWLPAALATVLATTLAPTLATVLATALATCCAVYCAGHNAGYLLRWLLRTLLCAVVFALSARKRIALQCRVRFLLPVVRCLPFFVRVWCQGPA